MAVLAANQLKEKLTQASQISNELLAEGNGKMFGILVVKNRSGSVGYLAGFSGMLNQQWEVSGFVPPAFNTVEQAAFLRQGEAQLGAMSRTIEVLEINTGRKTAIDNLALLKSQSEHELSELKQSHQRNKAIRKARRMAIQDELTAQGLLLELSLLSQKDKKEIKQIKIFWADKLQAAQHRFAQSFENKINDLKAERRQLSQQLHDRVFETYRLQNSLGEVSSIKSLFDDKAPPGGTGDCAAPKLLQFAFQNKLMPLALAEFWYGGSPADGVRHHGEFYPPCRGKCQPILPFMLKGLDVMSEPVAEIKLEPEIVYQDAEIIVVDKPAGLLSIPGKEQVHSVWSWLKKKYPDATGPLLVHRLDMATSGLLLAAKNSQSHKNLQKQFLQRSVEKRYVAVLSKKPDPAIKTIDLPLRVDLDDRPRQMVCYEHGKKAVTKVEVISTDEHSSRVYFYPLTGRTHQLRVHAAHSKGLGAPIVGDELYGIRNERMLLHAQRLVFDHPTTGERMMLELNTPF